eukprot:TRINITY_DN79463_c0_g1_i1.p1 TRINITY_DN79463_c0_g1~~TRINITY_DN79463_c0_g1_i1.p1  ORF type:complete len:160 (-),score=39.01 TRINITY_DN79463_c0_g1_i1:40-450(-)
MRLCFQNASDIVHHVTSCSLIALMLIGTDVLLEANWKTTSACTEVTLQPFQLSAEAPEADVASMIQLTLSKDVLHKAKTMADSLSSLRQRLMGGGRHCKDAADADASGRRINLLTAAVIAYCVMQTSAKQVVLISM